MTTALQADNKGWQYLAWSLPSIRFVQGWIYWGGGSRRFIYAPSKLDPTAHHWMAYKFQTAMPGALLGMDHVISYLLTHFTLLYAAVILFSAVELVAGLFLVIGFMTRASALISMGISFFLMLLFGWQGATCIDEWTMAAANFGMGATLFLAGAGAWSVDALRQRPHQAANLWHWAASAPLPERWMAPMARGILIITMIFVVSTYSYYRGSVWGPFHGGPVSPAKHHVSFTHIHPNPDGSWVFHAYLDGGTADVPAHIMRITLLDSHNNPLALWQGQDLQRLPKTAFINDYPYNKFAPGIMSLQAPVGAKAWITLPAEKYANTSHPDHLQALLIDGQIINQAITPDR
ncbi:MAG: quinol oxidase [Pseudomonadales bacterium]|nr:quinol oxidase [Pseudomonadales bacterium]